MGGNTSKGQSLAENMISQVLISKGYRKVVQVEFDRMVHSGERTNCFVQQAKYRTWKGTLGGRADLVVMRKSPKKIGRSNVSIIHIESKHQDVPGTASTDKLPAVFIDFEENSLNADSQILILTGKEWKRKGAKGSIAMAENSMNWAKRRAEKLSSIWGRHVVCVHADEVGELMKKLL